MKKRMMAVVITLIMTSTFVGCSSTAAEPVKGIKSEETTVAVKEETVEVAEVKEVEAEPTPEPTPEPTSEAITEETRTIDMESTLPGKDWLKTFKGIVEEPIFVVFNDETNKKVMVEIGGKVFIEEGDFLALYNPNGVDVSEIVGSAVKRLDTYSNFTICTFNKEEFPEENNFTLVLDTGEEFTCIMVADFD
ncbi:MAG: hypothetical protein IJO65_02685 [Lachnospiraceae bacterium]|nr:hypothetical protein [Lachnospiraceae bacterium]